jgi:signal transduction histidine kinase
MGMILLAIPKNDDLLGILKNFWALAVFGLIHGTGEWVDMLIQSGGPFDARILTITGTILLPVSFVFIVLFGALNILERHPGHKWLIFLPVVCLLPWVLTYFTGKGELTAGIMARYFICLPGIILVIIDLISRLALYRKALPRFVLLSALVFIFASGIYAVSSGLIVPKADFFPASLINYDSFIRIFGFPVQIVRMLCAILIAAGAFGMTGVFYKHKTRARLIGGIRRKFLFFVVLFTLILLGTSVLMQYLSGVFMLRKIIFSNQQAIVQLMANSVGELIESEVKKLQNNVESPSIWGAVIDDANFKYSAIPVKGIPEYFAKKDKEWLQLPSDSPTVEKYINTQLSLRLKRIVEAGNIAEIFFTDRYGGLVVASQKTSDFYQADEEWWQKTFASGKGNVFVGDMEFDDSSNSWSITISVPVYDRDLEVIGVCKVVYNTLKFFEMVSKFEIGSTGRAFLFDNHGKLICQSGHKLTKIDKDLILPEWNVIKEMQSRKVFQSASYISHDSGSTFLISWGVIPNEVLLKQGVKWTASVEQDAKEVFVGQEFVLLLYSIVLFGVLVILSIYFSFLFFRLLIQPIEKMRLGMREIAKGNLSYYLNIRSGDELEDLADSFNLMIDTLRKTLVSKEALITEVAERKQVECMLEQSKDKLEKQARELNTQLKDAEKTYDLMISMLEDNNIIRGALEKSLAELKQAQEMMVQVAKLGAIGQLASGVAHEVKNPLGIILQGINYLENKIPGQEKDAHEVLEMMKDGINRADKIINGLLDFSKSTKLELRQEDINSVLESSINLAQVSATFSGVEIVKEMSKSAPKVKIDKNKMEQVFINILVNAAQAMENKGKITVRSYVKKLERAEKSRINKEVDYFNAGEEALMVEIEDTGEGISEENLKKIFDAFFSTKGPKGGAGLGLGVCLSIVDMHKGLIDVESQLGKGTKVTITLKLSPDEQKEHGNG